MFYEEDGVGTVCVVLSRGQLDGTSATVALSSSSGSASSGSEITPHHQPLVPPPHLQVTSSTSVSTAHIWRVSWRGLS